MLRAVFLDRDGVLNRCVVVDGKPYPPATVAEFQILEGVAEACRMLADAGYALIGVTNQPDVARGKTLRSTIEGFHEILLRDLPLHSIRTCFHDDKDECACRKPRPGLLLDAASEYGVDLAASFMVGDRWKDVSAGIAAGCRTVFIDYGYREKQPESADLRTDSLLSAANWIVGQNSEEQ